MNSQVWTAKSLPAWGWHRVWRWNFDVWFDSFIIYQL